MRMFMSVQLPTQSGNAAVENGALAKVMGRFIETFRPEAAYFITVDGERCAHLYFDMQDAAQMPPIAEPMFMLGAKVTYCPAMNGEDLKKGIGAYMAGR